MEAMQNGRAERGPQVNAAGHATTNIYITGTAPPVQPPAADPPVPSAPVTAPRSGGGLIAVAVIAVLVFCFIKIFFPSTPDLNAFPAKSDPWPAGATRDALLASVTVSWRSCAQAVVLAPANCPEHVDSYQNDNVEGVRWVLHGDPVDGVVLRYRDQDHLFHVLGAVVLTVTYHGSAGPGFASLHLYYWTRVTWSDGKAAVTDLAGYGGKPQWTISKHDPGLPAGAVKPLVVQAFQRCFAAKTMPMPADCPNSSPYTAPQKATWTSLGNPLVNAKPHFEPTFGLIHVVGSYSTRVRYSVWPFGPQSEVQGGDYDATLSIDDGKPVLLQIQAS